MGPIFAIIAIKWSKVTGVDDESGELFRVSPVFSASLLFSLIQKFGETEMKEMVVKIMRKGTRPDNDNWRRIYVVFAVTKILAKIILELTKELLEGLIDREQYGFHPVSSCKDHIYTVRIIMEIVCGI